MPPSERVTYLYCRPGVLDTKKGEVDVDLALQHLAFELGREQAPMFRTRGGTSIVVPGVGPDEVWSAMEKIAATWQRRGLFVLPGTYGPFSEP